MAGILDALAAMLSGQGGGVLGGLPASFNDRWNGLGDTPPASFADRFGYAPPLPPAQDIAPAPQPNAAFPSAGPVNTMPIGGYQMPQFGAATDYAPQTALPASAPPTQGQMTAASAAAPAPDSTGLFGLAPHRISDALASLSRGGTLRGAVSGQYDDPQSQQAQVQNVTAKALLAKGAPAEDVMAAMKNPDVLKALVGQYYGKDKWKLQKVSQDGLGAESYAWVNETNGTSKPFIAGGRSPNDDGALPANARMTQGVLNAQGSTTPEETYVAQGATLPESTPALGNPNLTGEAYLASMPAENAAVVKKMVAGQIAPPSSFALAKPYWQGIMKAAANYDPEFDATKWAARYNMAKSAQGDGKMGQNNNAIITGIGHLSNLSDAIAGLGNSDYSQTYNWIKNAILTEFGGTGATNFRAIANRVAPEIVRIWRGTGGAEADIKRDIESLSTADTPAQLHGAIANIAGMMRTKLESNQEEYQATMGKDLPMTAAQQKMLAVLDVLQGRAGAAASAAAPVYKEGDTATNPTTGQRLTYHDGKWQ